MARSPRKRKFKPTFIGSIVVVAMVLYVLSVSGLAYGYFDLLAAQARQNVSLTVILKDPIVEADVNRLRQRLESEPFVRKTVYTTKAEALAEFEARHGDIMKDLVWANPVPASIDIFLNDAYQGADSLAMVTTYLDAHFSHQIRELVSDTDQLVLVDKYLGIAGAALAGTLIILVFVALVLIDNTVRLAMYSNRFLLRNMQLIGANRWFIVKPYVTRAFLNGFISATIALLALFATSRFVEARIPELLELRDIRLWAIVVTGTMCVGILISWWSTHRSVFKYLKMRLDDLY